MTKLNRLKITVYNGLKSATDDLIEKIGGGRRCAPVTGRARHQAFDEFGSLEHMDRWINIKEVVELEDKARSPILTRVMAQMQGYELVKVPHVEDPGDWAKVVGRMSKETGEALNAVLQAFANDGCINCQEIKRLRIDGELDEAIQALLSMRMAIDATMEAADADD